MLPVERRLCFLGASELSSEGATDSVRSSAGRCATLMLEAMGGRDARCWRGVVMATVGEAFGVGIVDVSAMW